MRSYTSLFRESGYLCLQTYKTRWVLDYEHKTDEDYAMRRLKLKTDILKPYKLYPLNRIHYRMGTVIRSRHRLFIDSTGRLVKFSPKKFHTVHIARIKASWVTQTGHKAYKVTQTARTFIAENGDYSHLAYVKVGRLTFLFDLIKREDYPDYKVGRVKL